MARAALLELMPPYQGGGDMISSVTFEKTIYNKVPHRFEAGTPHIAGVIGLGAAIEYVSGVGIGAIGAHEHELLEYATERVGELRSRSGWWEPRKQKKPPAAVLSFVMDGIHPHDIGTILDQAGIAVRTGHHCAQPVMDRFGIPATVRASFGLYNTREEIDALMAWHRKGAGDSRLMTVITARHLSGSDSGARQISAEFSRA